MSKERDLPYRENAPLSTSPVEAWDASCGANGGVLRVTSTSEEAEADEDTQVDFALLQVIDRARRQEVATLEEAKHRDEFGLHPQLLRGVGGFVKNPSKPELSLSTRLARALNSLSHLTDLHKMNRWKIAAVLGVLLTSGTTTCFYLNDNAPTEGNGGPKVMTPELLNRNQILR